MSDLGLSLAWCGIQITLLGILVYVACVASERWRLGMGASLCAGSTVGILALTGLSFAPWPWPCWITASAPNASVASEAAASSPAASNRLAAAGNSPVAPAEPVPREAGAPANYVGAFVTALGDELTRSPRAIQAPGPWRWPAVLAAVAAVGFTIGMLQLGVGLVMVSRCRRRSRPIGDGPFNELLDLARAEFGYCRGVELRESDEIGTPATIGWRRPVILLPTGWTSWTQPQRHAVLSHEMAHITHRDFATCLLVHVCLALHYYHPLVHWLARRLRLEQELLADRSAAERLGGTFPYLSTLAEMALRQSDRSMGWPAQCFLPTRGAFLRRIAMLKETRLERSPRAGRRPARWLVAGFLVVGVVLVSGVRMPHDEARAHHPDSAGAPAGEIDLSWVPRDAAAVAVVRPADLAGRPELADLTNFIRPIIQEAWGLDIGDIEQVVMHTTGRGPAGASRPGLVIQARGRADFSRVLRDLQRPEERSVGGIAYVRCADTGYAFHRPDDRTLVGDYEAALVLALSDPDRRTPAFASTDDWKRLARSQIALYAKTELLRDQWNPLLGMGRGPRPVTWSPAEMAVFAPLWEDTDSLLLAIDAQEKLAIELIAATGDAAGAKDVSETLSAMRTLGRNASREFRRQFAKSPDANQPLVTAALEFAERLLDDAAVESQGTTVSVKTEGDLRRAQLGPLTLAVMQARKAAQEQVGINNLKQIALAMHNYYDVHQSMPPAVVIGSDGVTPHSWRVAILPFLDEVDLYNQYRFDEPWDSEHNRRLIAKIPAVYRLPTSPADGNAGYYLMTHESAIFNGSSKTRFKDIMDGTSNTLLVVEAQRDVPWTRPDDIAWDPRAKLPPIGAMPEKGFNAALADGSVRFFPADLDERDVKAMLTAAGGETFRIR